MHPRKSLVKRRVEVPTEGTPELPAASLLSASVALAASRVTELAPLQGLLPDGEDDNFISFGKIGGGGKISSSSSSSSDMGDIGDEADEGSAVGGYESDRSEVPDKAEEMISPTSPTARDSFSGVVFEQRVAIDIREAHLTLLTLPSPLTIQGPCGLYGIGGETSLNGYLIGSKRFLLATRADKATAAPVKRLGTKSSEVSAPPHEDTDPETIFGVVNWAWVRERLESWQRRNPVQMSILLVIQHRDTSKKQWFEKGAATSSPRELPSFIANYRYLATPPAILDILSTIAKQRSAVVAVVGEKDVGKSTMCRMAANALLSQHGKCYWVDLDLGQPEFTVPGCLSVVRVKRPLTTEIIPAESWTMEKNIFLGATHIACPISYAVALAHLTAYIKEKALFPCVINSHGWVQSTGRRGTLECLRRLRASFIIHLGREGGADMEWTTGRIIGDPSLGMNESMSEGRFWHGTGVLSCPMPAPESPIVQFKCRIQHVETSKNAGNGSAIRSGKREREVDNDDDGAHKQQQQQQADSIVYRIMADYITRPKGDNVKRRRAKWFNYFNPLWADDESLRSVVTIDLAKLSFIAVAAADEATTTALRKSSDINDMLSDSIVAVAIREDAVTGGAETNFKGRPMLLSNFPTPPSTLCFGIVTKPGKGVIELSLPHTTEFIESAIAVHKGRIGIVVAPDRGDYAGVLYKTTKTQRK